MPWQCTHGSPKWSFSWRNPQKPKGLALTNHDSWAGTRYKRHLAHGANSRAAGRSLGVESRRLASQFQPPCFDLPTDLQKRSTSEHPKLRPSSQESGTQWHGVILYQQIAFPRRKNICDTWILNMITGYFATGFLTFLVWRFVGFLWSGGLLAKMFQSFWRACRMQLFSKKIQQQRTHHKIMAWPMTWRWINVHSRKKTQEVEISTIVTIPQPQPNSSPNPPTHPSNWKKKLTPIFWHPFGHLRPGVVAWVDSQKVVASLVGRWPR